MSQNKTPPTLGASAPFPARPYGELEADGEPMAVVRLRVQLFLRWLAIIGQLVAVLVIYFGFGFSLPLTACLVVIGLAVGLNLSLILLFPANHFLNRRETASYLAYDIAQLGLLLFLTGGVMNPFALLLLAPVTISASLLNARTTAALIVFAGFIVSFLALYHLPLPWRGTPPQIPDLFRFGVWAALMLALAFIPAYVWRVSREGRRMSAALTATRSVLAREQRLSALDGMAAAAAHQLGTPLGTIVLVLSELGARDDLPEGLSDDVALMREQALRCRDILSSLSSEDNDPVISRISLRGLLEEAVLEAGDHDKQIFVSSQANGLLATSEPLVTRQPELIYGLGNLIENAAEFAHGSVWVQATYSAQQVVIEIADDGPGFAADILTHLGEPYTSSRRSKFSRDETGDFGLGLGFFIARTLMQRSGGKISARNLKVTEMVDGQMPGGACVRVVWPRDRLAG
jgi:two-component system sensor histidine kinase RegB